METVIVKLIFSTFSYIFLASSIYRWRIQSIYSRFEAQVPVGSAVFRLGSWGELIIYV